VGRNYSCPFLHNQALYNAHLKLASAFDSPSTFRPLYEDMLSAERDNIELHIKKQGRLSVWLHGLNPENDEFEIRGPFVHICV
jgi:hypothetical protein